MLDNFTGVELIFENSKGEAKTFYTDGCRKRMVNQWYYWAIKKGEIIELLPCHLWDLISVQYIKDGKDEYLAK